MRGNIADNDIQAAHAINCVSGLNVNRYGGWIGEKDMIERRLIRGKSIGETGIQFLFMVNAIRDRRQAGVSQQENVDETEKIKNLDPAELGCLRNPLGYLAVFRAGLTVTRRMIMRKDEGG